MDPVLARVLETLVLCIAVLVAALANVRATRHAQRRNSAEHDQLARLLAALEARLRSPAPPAAAADAEPAPPGDDAAAAAPPAPRRRRAAPPDDKLAIWRRVMPN